MNWKTSFITHTNGHITKELLDHATKQRLEASGFGVFAECCDGFFAGRKTHTHHVFVGKPRSAARRANTSSSSASNSASASSAAVIAGEVESDEDVGAAASYAAPSGVRRAAKRRLSGGSDGAVSESRSLPPAARQRQSGAASDDSADDDWESSNTQAYNRQQSPAALAAGSASVAAARNRRGGTGSRSRAASATGSAAAAGGSSAAAGQRNRAAVNNANSAQQQGGDDEGEDEAEGEDSLSAAAAAAQAAAAAAQAAAGAGGAAGAAAEEAAAGAAGGANGAGAAAGQQHHQPGGAPQAAAAQQSERMAMRFWRYKVVGAFDRLATELASTAPDREEKALRAKEELFWLGCFRRSGEGFMSPRPPAVAGAAAGNQYEEEDDIAAEEAAELSSAIAAAAAAAEAAAQQHNGIVPDDIAMIVRAVYQCAVMGLAGKGMQALEGNKLAPLTPATQGKVRLLYPPAPAAAAEALQQQQQQQEPQGEINQQQRDEEDAERANTLTPFVRSYLASRKPGGGGGLSGWTYDLLKLAFDVKADPELDICKPLARLVVQIAAGRLDTPALRAPFVTQRGIALKKGGAAAADAGAGAGAGAGGGQEAEPAAVRPIGILEVISRLTSGALVSWLQSTGKLREQLDKHDLGMGVPAGTEAAGHAIRARLAAEPDHIVLKMDCAHAYGNIRRDKVLETADSIPGIAGYIRTLYGSPSDVIFSERGKDGRTLTVEMQTGVIQGDGLSGWVWDITNMRAIQSLRAWCGPRECSILTIHDDQYIVGPAAPAFEAYDRLKLVLRDDLGIDVNLTKTVALSLSQNEAVVADVSDRAAAAGISFTTEGIVVAGVPVGTTDFVRAKTREVFEETARLLTLLQRAVTEVTLPGKIPAVQGIMRTIRMCIPSRVNHLLRTVPPSITRPLAQQLDRRVFRAVMAILDQQVGDPDVDAAASLARLRLHLPVYLGGFGFTRLEDVCEAAFIGSWSLVGPVVREVAFSSNNYLQQHPEAAVGLEEALTALKGRVGSKELKTVAPLTVEAIVMQQHNKPPSVAAAQPQPEDGHDDNPAPVGRRAAPPGSQAAISAEIAQQRQDEVLAAIATVQEKTLFVSGAGAGSGAWVTAGISNQTAMPDVVYRCAAALRLGLPMPLSTVRDAPNGQVQCCCGKMVSSLGHHAFCCNRFDRYDRHNLIKYALFNAVYRDSEAVSGGLQGRMEIGMDAIFPRKPAAPAGNISCDIHELHRNKATHQHAIDVTVTFPQPSVKHDRDSSTLIGRGMAAEEAEKRKMAHYGARCTIPEGGLVPLAMEVGGTMGRMGDSHIRKVIREHVRPLRVIELPDGKPKHVDHGARYATFLRRLREHLAVALQRGNVNLISEWHRRLRRPPQPAAAAAQAAAAGAGAGG